MGHHWCVPLISISPAINIKCFCDLPYCSAWQPSALLRRITVQVMSVLLPRVRARTPLCCLPHKQPPCLQIRAIWRSNKWLFLTALPFKLVNDGAQFVGPIFLNLLLGVVSKGQPSSLGYTYAVLMLLGLWTGTLADNQHFQRVMRTGQSQYPMAQCTITDTSGAAAYSVSPPAKLRKDERSSRT